MGRGHAEGDTRDVPHDVGTSSCSYAHLTALTTLSSMPSYTTSSTMRQSSTGRKSASVLKSLISTRWSRKSSWPPVRYFLRTCSSARTASTGLHARPFSVNGTSVLRPVSLSTSKSKCTYFWWRSQAHDGPVVLWSLRNTFPNIPRSFLRRWALMRS